MQQPGCILALAMLLATALPHAADAKKKPQVADKATINSADLQRAQALYDEGSRLYNEAQALFDQKAPLEEQEAKYKAAAKKFNDALKIAPSGKPELYFNLARCYDRLGQYDDANAAYTAYLQTYEEANNKAQAPDAQVILDRIKVMESRMVTKMPPIPANDAPPPAATPPTPAPTPPTTAQPSPPIANPLDIPLAPIPAPTKRPSMALPITFGVAGAVALGVGIGLIADVSNQVETLANTCHTTCDPAVVKPLEDRATASYITLGVGAGLGVVSAALGIRYVVLNKKGASAQLVPTSSGAVLVGVFQ